MQALDSIDSNALSQGPDLDEMLVHVVCGALDRIATTPNPSQDEAYLTTLLLRCLINKHTRLGVCFHVSHNKPTNFFAVRRRSLLCSQAGQPPQTEAESRHTCGRLSDCLAD